MHPNYRTIRGMTGVVSSAILSIYLIVTIFTAFFSLGMQPVARNALDMAALAFTHWSVAGLMISFGAWWLCGMLHGEFLHNRRSPQKVLAMISILGLLGMWPCMIQMFSDGTFLILGDWPLRHPGLLTTTISITLITQILDLLMPRGELFQASPKPAVP
jgi:hypothetical protein